MKTPVHLDFLSRQNEKTIKEYLKETTPKEFIKDIERLVEKYSDKRNILDLLKEIEKLC